MKLIAVLLLLFLPTRGMTQSPVKQTLAYSRATTSGIPGRDTGGASTGTPFPPTYFIYVVITKDIPVVASRACVLGTSYATTLRRVSSPVVVDQNVSGRCVPGRARSRCRRLRLERHPGHARAKP